MISIALTPNKLTMPSPRANIRRHNRSSNRSSIVLTVPTVRTRRPTRADRETDAGIKMAASLTVGETMPLPTVTGRRPGGRIYAAIE